MKPILLVSIFLTIALIFSACKKDLPIDEDGLLITDRSECYVTNMDLIGTNYTSARAVAPTIDTAKQTINIMVNFGTDLKNLRPVFTLAPDCKLDPKIAGFEDFSDLANPKKYTVISGNRQVKKTYSVFVTVKPR